MNDEVKKHYDSVAEHYHEQYDEAKLMSLPYYPANFFRLQMLVDSFASKGIKRVIEVGVGEGTPLATLAETGMDVWGFDISPEMVAKSKATVIKSNVNPEQIAWGDIEDESSYKQLLKGGLFDGLMAMGVMPHVKNDQIALKNMTACVKKGGSVFIEFRNKLFSLFTFNRYSMEFITEDLLKDVDSKVKEAVRAELASRFRMDLPKTRTSEGNKHNITGGYDQILSKFHNPVEVREVFENLGFSDIKFLWYHYHPAPPMIEEKLGDLYRKEAFKLEGEKSGWRGMFLCSAFVVEAIKN